MADKDKKLLYGVFIVADKYVYRKKLDGYVKFTKEDIENHDKNFEQFKKIHKFYEREKQIEEALKEDKKCEEEFKKQEKSSCLMIADYRLNKSI